MRRIGAGIIAVAVIAVVCTGSSEDNKPDAAPGLDGSAGFVDKAAFRARQDDYLAFATRADTSRRPP